MVTVPRWVQGVCWLAVWLGLLLIGWLAVVGAVTVAAWWLAW